ncbi:MAG: TonB-dependent receptor plug domain-containing protein [Planctomycetota bacterium]|jgi:iron complex outermembrane receptor protein
MKQLLQPSLAFCLVTAATVLAADEPVERFEADTFSEPSTLEADQGAVDVTTDGLDELDQLLEIAENDAAQLGEVSVVAPALQEVVSTVSRQKSTVGKSPAAVFVITNEMIRRSSARSLPEVLRMAPGVQVARIDANKWEVSIRGFNGRFANKLLVQIDGRSVYTPLFAGVFWDAQNVLLEDVERIEVIRGPGGTIWGANAVNGVINIITKKARDTEGVFIESGGGNERAFSSARVGGQLSENAWYRIFGKWYERDAGAGRGFDPGDDNRMRHLGGRIDWELDNDTTLTVQGDYYEGTNGIRSLQAVPLPTGRSFINTDMSTSGGNILTRISQRVTDDSDWSLQLYYDRTKRDPATIGIQDMRDMFDLDFQHRSNPWVDHSVIWGLEYRYHTDNMVPTPFQGVFTPISRDFDIISGFVQDETTLIDDVLTFTAGSKFEHNDFSGFEFQPSARLLWTPDERHSIWASASRAVRTPSRSEEDGRFTFAASPAAAPSIFPVLTGTRALEAEDLMAYEAGYREQVTDEFAWDIAAFFYEYRDLITTSAGAPSFMLPEGPVLPLAFQNQGERQHYGFDLSASWEVTPTLSLLGSYSFLRIHGGGNDPINRFYIQSSWDVTDNVDFDAILRYVDGSPGTNVDQYAVMDLRLGIEPAEGLELFVVGRNLMDGDHVEAVDNQFSAASITAVEREVFAGVTLRY